MKTKLVASMMVGPGEPDRYLAPALEHLAGFCDEIRIRQEVDDRITGWVSLNARCPINVLTKYESTFFEHEGRARNELLAWTLEAKPTHVLAVDADELVTDGAAVRAACEKNAGRGSWSLTMEEVWKADERHLWTRQDGGWREHPVPILWRVPPRLVGDWRIADRQLACGREPVAVRKLGRPLATGASCLHFGWANVADRQARYERYVTADGGRFHASSHLRSIMWDDSKVRLQRRPWPAGLDKAAILERVRRQPVAV